MTNRELTDRTQVDRILDAARPGATVTAIEPVSTGNRRETTVVQFRDSDPVVIQQSGDYEAIATAARLRELIAHRTSVPVPRPIASGGSEAGWLVAPYVSGADLHERFTALDRSTRRSLVEAFGRYLGRLHESFNFDGYGPLTAVDGALHVTEHSPEQIGGGLAVDGGVTRSATTATDWERWLTDLATASLDRLPAAFDDLVPQLREEIRTASIDEAPTPTLFPWDFRPGNALVADGELAAILDWEGPLAASAALSYANSRYLVADWYVPDERGRLREAFRQGYESVRPVPEVNPIHEITAITSTAVDSRGVVTNPGYPPVDREKAVAFHRDALTRSV